MLRATPLLIASKALSKSGPAGPRLRTVGDQLRKLLSVWYSCGPLYGPIYQL